MGLCTHGRGLRQLAARLVSQRGSRAVRGEVRRHHDVHTPWEIFTKSGAAMPKANIQEPTEAPHVQASAECERLRMHDIAELH